MRIVVDYKVAPAQAGGKVVHLNRDRHHGARIRWIRWKSKAQRRGHQTVLELLQEGEPGNGEGRCF